MKTLAVILVLAASVFAQDAAMNPGSGMASLLPMMILFFVVIYFFMIRPEQKKQKEMDKMRTALKVGDEVVTMAGICGTVHKIIDDKKIVIKIDEKAMMTILTVSVGNVNPSATETKADK
ncbi:MAG: preprotein translocase subunit YajC [Chitinivibrionia bacterium]|nr:preprotein translocase subunit YajC [Chitinivibrionia bacterium]